MIDDPKNTNVISEPDDEATVVAAIRRIHANGRRRLHPEIAGDIDISSEAREIGFRQVARKYLGDERHQRQIGGILWIIQRQSSDADWPGTPRKRREEFLSLARQVTAIIDSLEGVEPGPAAMVLPLGLMRLARAMPPEGEIHGDQGETAQEANPDRVEQEVFELANGEHVTQTTFPPGAARYLGAYKDAIDTLHALATGFGALADMEPVPGGRPPSPRHAYFGVNLLADLWRAALGREPNLSRNRGSFSEFVKEVFAMANTPALSSPGESVVRRVLADRRRPSGKINEQGSI